MPYGVLDAASAAAAPSVVLGAPIPNGEGSLAVLRAAVRREVAERGEVTDSELDRYVNWSYKAIAGMVDVPELHDSFGYTLVATQPLYRLPERVAWIQAAAIVSSASWYGGRQLLQIDQRQYRRLEDRSDDPRNYFRFRDVLVLWPTPKSVRTLAVDVRVRPKDLALDSDAPLLPPEIHEAIVLGARARVERNAQMISESHTSWNMMLGLIRPLLDPLAEERTHMEVHMQPAERHRDLYRAASYGDVRG